MHQRYVLQNNLSVSSGNLAGQAGVGGAGDSSSKQQASPSASGVPPPPPSSSSTSTSLLPPPPPSASLLPPTPNAFPPPMSGAGGQPGSAGPASQRGPPPVKFFVPGPPAASDASSAGSSTAPGASLYSSPYSSHQWADSNTSTSEQQHQALISEAQTAPVPQSQPSDDQQHPHANGYPAAMDTQSLQVRGGTLNTCSSRPVGLRFGKALVKTCPTSVLHPHVCCLLEAPTALAPTSHTLALHAGGPCASGTHQRDPCQWQRARSCHTSPHSSAILSATTCPPSCRDESQSNALTVRPEEETRPVQL